MASAPSPDGADPTPLESRIVQAFPRGVPVDARRRTAEGDPPDASGRRTGTRPPVRASVLRELLLSGRADGIPGLHLTGVTVTGRLDLAHAEIPCPVRFVDCDFQHPVELSEARVRRLDLCASRMPALTATGIRVESDLGLADCEVTGPVRLDRARVEGDIRAARLRVRGALVLETAQADGALDLEDARLHGRGGDALDARNLTLGTLLNAGGLDAEGRVRLTGCTAGGWISFMEARLHNPGGVALGLSSCEARQLTLRDARPIAGEVRLHHSAFKAIEADPGVWPPSVSLEGLVYESLSPRLPADRRLPLLECDRSGFLPHSYEQLARSYRAAGEDAEARTVLLAAQRRRRRSLPWPARVWGHVQDVTVGYGFRPARAVAWLLTLLLAGTVAFGLDEPTRSEPGKGPPFNAPVYAADLLLPVVDFGQEKAFAPTGPHQWLAVLLVASGWIFATTVAAGVTRSLTRP